MTKEGFDSEKARAEIDGYVKNLGVLVKLAILNSLEEEFPTMPQNIFATVNGKLQKTEGIYIYDEFGSPKEVEDASTNNKEWKLVLQANGIFKVPNHDNADELEPSRYYPDMDKKVEIEPKDYLTYADLAIRSIYLISWARNSSSYKKISR